MVYQINLISSSLELYNLIKKDERFNIHKVYIEKNTYHEELGKTIQEDIVLVEDYSSFEQDIIETFARIDFNIIFLSGIIIGANLIQKKDFYNIHPGNLYVNRGRHPLNWSLINGDDETTYTLHKIDEKIDNGEIIYEQSIKIEYFETIPSLCQKLYESLPVFIEKLIAYKKGLLQGTVISHKGIYRPRITEKDITIDFETDTDKIIIRKINSQATYAGAVLWIKNEKYHLKNIIEVKKQKNEKRSIVFYDDIAELLLSMYTIKVTYCKN